MSLENFAKNVREILDKEEKDVTLEELQKVVFKGLEKEYNNLKKGQLTIALQNKDGKNEYNLYPHDPLLMLKFKHRIKSKLKKKDIDELDNAKIFMHLPDGKTVEVIENDTFEQLKKEHKVDPSYFSFKVKTTFADVVVAKKFAEKKITQIKKQNEGKKEGDILMSGKDANMKEIVKGINDKVLPGACKGKNDIGKKQCPAVNNRIKNKQMSNKARKSICNSYANCKWEPTAVTEVMLGGRKKKRRKKKKAFPSRKKTHRKNSTKKRARK